jgi:acyl-CoA synthetase (AMP-forming)/AMP-acid ligase II
LTASGIEPGDRVALQLPNVPQFLISYFGILKAGAVVMAVIILRPGMVLAEHELVSYCRGQLAAYKCPRVYQFRAQLPKNTLGKVLKDELARMAGGRA